MVLPALLLSAGTVLTNILTWACQRLLIFLVVLITAYSCGWFHRFVWWFVEREAAKLLNGTPVTCSSLDFDLTTGKAWATNVIVHAPNINGKSDVWEAPVLARLGSVYVECNAVACVLSLWFLWKEVPVEIYTLQVSDIQVFVERRQDNLYNFFLLDPHIVLTPESGSSSGEKTRSDSDPLKSSPIRAADVHGDVPTKPPVPIHQASDREVSAATTEEVLDDDDAKKAQQVVDDMLHAVRRAATSSQPWKTSLLTHYRQTLSDVQKSNRQQPASRRLHESVQVMKHILSNQVQEKSRAAQTMVLGPNRQEIPGERPVYGRIGRVVLSDARIFLQRETTNDDDDNTSSSSAFAAPIYIERVAIRPNEFCPPNSAVDHEDDGSVLPALYQPLDACLEVVWKRVLAEFAKSNTGRFFQTAMWEMADALTTSGSAASAEQQPPAAEVAQAAEYR